MSESGHVDPEAPAISGMTQERSRQIGRALMALAAVQFLCFFGGAVRRSYLVIAVPLGIAVGVVSGVLFWVGYTMATKDWDNPADWPPEEPGAEA
ncbi:MAG: hypothetical protein M0R73_08145 [Dehalococcoidia bacterium]|nr:hypothetical protein [Dehalococcoidia bacterium]